MKQKIMERIDFSNSGRTSEARGTTALDTPSKKKGFSINEVMISMFVLSVGIVTVIGLFSKGFINSALDRDRIVAAGLAQEGVELVKNVRDNSFADGGDGFTSFNDYGSNPPDSSDRLHCQMSYDDSNMNCRNAASGLPADHPDLYDLNRNASGYYTNSNGVADTRFYRYIHIEYSATNKAAEIISFVYWGGATPPANIHLNIDSDSNGTPDNGSVANCHIGNKCVYSKVRLENWKP
jgi:hypothetical protein